MARKMRRSNSQLLDLWNNAKKLVRQAAVVSQSSDIEIRPRGCECNSFEKGGTDGKNFGKRA